MIRKYRNGDHLAISTIFPEAIYEIASEVYSEEQINAWTKRKPDPAHWQKRCLKKQPFVYELGGRVVGFLELDPDGHIDCMYVHPSAKRRGIASELIQKAIEVTKEKGLRKVFVEASICAKPVFEKKGFEVVNEQTVEIRGVGLKNFKMEIEITNRQNKSAHTTPTSAPR